tara:strand:- start:67 stop:462 length:396 start_codon:yes stop_codon:yes gene_type:complete
MIIVYKIINEEGIVEHVGHTHNTEQRFHGHTKQTPGDGKGKFYKRTDVMLEVISEWETREQARTAETYWQVYYHLQDNGGYVKRKYTDEQIEYIRSSDKTQRELGLELDIPNSTIWKIRNYKIYNTVNDPA